MTKQGKVVGQPVVIGGNGDAVAQQAAIAAVMACAPYDWLPQELITCGRKLSGRLRHAKTTWKDDEMTLLKRLLAALCGCC